MRSPSVGRDGALGGQKPSGQQLQNVDCRIVWLQMLLVFFRRKEAVRGRDLATVCLML